MRLPALIGLVLIATSGVYQMASAQPPQPAITLADDGSASGSVTLPLGRELELVLSANPTTGYTWRLALGDFSRMRLESRQYQPSVPAGEAPRPGAGGLERFVFEATAPGTERLHFEYRRGEGGEPGRTYDLMVTIVP